MHLPCLAVLRMGQCGLSMVSFAGMHTETVVVHIFLLVERNISPKVNESSITGVAVRDLFIIIPNGLGAFLGVLQIILYISFPRTPVKYPLDMNSPQISAMNDDRDRSFPPMATTSEETAEPLETTPLLW